MQGVFFRQWTIDQARALSVAGWVRNRPDGSLEAHLQGEETAVTQMAARMRKGPASARVDDVMIEDAEPQEIEGFRVRL